jgi:hypothetical protein
MKTFSLTAVLLLAVSASAATIPSTTGTALDGHAVTLPRDLPARATVLILGFSQHSAGTTTAWERPLRASLPATSTTGGPAAVGYLDMPCLEDAPSFIRPLILRSIRKQVPVPLRRNFVPLTSGGAAWKQLTHFSPVDPDAAYILLVDRSGNIHWQTHQPYTPDLLSQLEIAARNLAAESK